MGRREIPPLVNLVRSMLILRERQGRDLAILGASWLDIVLEKSLRANMEQLDVKLGDALFGQSGYLHTLSAKIDLACSFAIISKKAMVASHQLRQVRNLYAHTLDDLSSDAPQIAATIGQMDFSLKDTMPFDKTSRDDSTFTFEGEVFTDGHGILADDPPHEILFFVPSVIVQPETRRDDLLRQHIYACIFAGLEQGLRGWIDETVSPGGIATWLQTLPRLKPSQRDED
jgi:hypothetical protein